MSKKILFIEEVNEFFKDLYQEVKRIRNIDDIKKRNDEAYEAMRKAMNQWNNGKILFAYNQYGKSDELGSWQDINLGFADLTGEKYEALSSPYSLLQRIFQESQSFQNRNSQPFRQQKPRNKSKKLTVYTCSKCSEAKSGNYYINTEEQDGKKFCSEICFNDYYSPLCGKCFQKCLDKIYYQDRKNKEGDLCSNCNEERKEKLQIALKELEKEFFKEPQVLPSDLGYKNIDDLIDLLKSVQDYGGLEDYLSELIISINQIRQSNNPINTKREELIQSEISNLTNKSNKAPEEQQWLANKKQQLENLNKNTNTPAKEPINWVPYIIGALGLFVAFIAVFFWLRKRKN